MPAQLGDPTGPGDHSKTRTAGEDLSAGDAVAISQDDGDVYKGDTDDADLEEFAGIVRDDADAGDTVTLVLEAPAGITASVATGVSGGERLSLGNATDGTVGQLDTEAGGPVLALGDEGGSTSDGRDLGDNEAEVAF